MEKYIHVMKKSLELADTILEGLQHVQKQLNEGKQEQTVFLFEDILKGYTAIERTITPVLTELNNEEIAAKLAVVRDAADLVVTAYEEKNYFKVQEILQFTLVPRFNKLKEELEQAFNPYIVS